jgi:hypothetical protein
MEKEFVTYELALRMKQLEFDEPCFSYYMNGILQPSLNVKDYSYFKEMIEINSNIKNFENVLAPLFQQAFRWFREKKEIEGFVHKSIEGNYYFVIKRLGNNESNIYEFTKTTPKNFDTYEEAELACLEKLIEIVEGRGE